MPPHRQSLLPCGRALRGCPPTIESVPALEREGARHDGEPHPQHPRRTALTGSTAPKSGAHTSGLHADHGNTSIAETVVQKIAGISAREVPGVHAVGNATRKHGASTLKLQDHDNRGLTIVRPTLLEDAISARVEELDDVIDVIDGHPRIVPHAGPDPPRDGVTTSRCAGTRPGRRPPRDVGSSCGTRPGAGGPRDRRRRPIRTAEEQIRQSGRNTGLTPVRHESPDHPVRTREGIDHEEDPHRRRHRTVRPVPRSPPYRQGTAPEEQAALIRSKAAPEGAGGNVEDAFE